MIQESDHNEKHDWYPLSPGMTFLSKLVLIYFSAIPKEISLIADQKMICRPDIVLKCTNKAEWLEKNGAKELKLGHDFLKPKFGTYVICRDGIPEDYYKALETAVTEKESASEQAATNPEENIHILEVGLDPSKLKPIVSALLANKYDRANQG